MKEAIFWVAVVYITGLLPGLATYIWLTYYRRSFCNMGDVTFAFLMSWLTIIAVITCLFEEYWRNNVEDIIVFDFTHRKDK